MADSNILKKTGAALSAYLTSAGVTANLYTGEGNDDKALPCVSCIGLSSETITGLEFTGNRSVRAQVEVRSLAADDAGEHAALVQQVGDALNITTLADSLSTALSGYTCLGAIPTGEEQDTDGDAWLHVFNLDLWGCCSDL